MKTKNILLPAIALLAGTLLSAPAYAQLSGDYHDDLEGIKQDIKIEVSTQIANQKSYLNVQLLYNQMNEDLPINLDEIEIAARNSLKDNQIPTIYQYDLMVLCIETNHSDVLLALLKAGFNPELGQELGLTSLPAKAVENNDLKAFAMTYPFDIEEKEKEIAEEVKNINPSLSKRLDEFKEKSQVYLIREIKQVPLKIDKLQLEKIKEQQQVYGEYLKKTDYNHGAILMMEPSAYEQMRKLDSIKNKLQNKGYTVDTVPAATKTIKVVSDTIPEQEEGIIGASYYNEHGTLVIKKFDKPLSDAEYQQWLKNNETMQRIHKNKVTEEKYKQMLDSIRKSQNK